MKKIIFVYPEKASFINLDIRILSEKFHVTENTYKWNNKKLLPFLLFKQLIFLLKKIRSTDSIVISFGGYWAILPTLIGKLYKKPVLIMLHGTDCTAFDEIKYGNIRKPILKFVLKISYKFASHLLPVSSSLVYTENTFYSKNKVIKQGYKNFFKENNTRKTIIHNGIDIDRWHILSNNKRKENRFITVLGEGQFVRKGGELIIETAKKLPQFEFYFIGINIPLSLSEIPDNVKFISKTKPEKLLELYNDSKYYLQLSIFEGFGYALCEAMASGCIPIVSSSNILPYIIGDTGYVLDHLDTNLLISLLLDIQKDNNNAKGSEARKRIVEQFTIEKRQEKLMEVIGDELNLFSKQ